MSHKRHNFPRGGGGGKVNEYKIRVSTFSTILNRVFVIIRRIHRDITIHVHRSSRNVSLFLSDFEKTCIFSTDFRRIPEYQI